ncbi:MAG: DUF1559 domain-containing protein [Thermoguttaceae bacterium]
MECPIVGKVATVPPIDPMTERVRGVLSFNWGIQMSGITDGTSQTALVAEMIVGSGCYYRGMHAYDEGCPVMFSYAPNSAVPDVGPSCNCGGSGVAATAGSLYFWLQEQAAPYGAKLPSGRSAGWVG